MTRPDETTRFLRAAIKAGLRMQRRASEDEGGTGSSPRSEGVAVLQRIRASLDKRQKRKQPT